MIRKIVIIAAVVAVTALFAYFVIAKERMLQASETVYLPLVPVDTRSLLQGDYMRLNYGLVREVADADADADLDDKGKLVLRKDAEGKAAFVRIFKGEELEEVEFLLNYRDRGGVDIAADTFFFQEGDAEYYENARYAELKVAADGSAILVGLRGEKLERLGPPE